MQGLFKQSPCIANISKQNITAHNGLSLDSNFKQHYAEFIVYLTDCSLVRVLGFRYGLHVLI